MLLKSIVKEVQTLKSAGSGSRREIILSDCALFAVLRFFPKAHLYGVPSVLWSEGRAFYYFD
jgi:hypothetical protein